jgi:cell wall-associated NlpC family hydrolase
MSPAISSLRSLAVEYAWSFLGRPYRWGGDDPMEGFDCSGLVNEVLQGVGLLPHRTDFTADALWRRFGAWTLQAPVAGALVLWMNPAGKATHVEMAISAKHTIGASGGGSATTSLDEAMRQNAFIKIRPFAYRGLNYKIVDPFASIGE